MPHLPQSAATSSHLSLLRDLPRRRDYRSRRKKEICAMILSSLTFDASWRAKSGATWVHSGALLGLALSTGAGRPVSQTLCFDNACRLDRSPTARRLQGWQSVVAGAECEATRDRERGDCPADGTRGMRRFSPFAKTTRLKKHCSRPIQNWRSRPCPHV
jgi:hypothetical protein